MKIAICVRPRGGITEGKVYPIVKYFSEFHTPFVNVINDQGQVGLYYADSFNIISGNITEEGLL